MRRRRVLVIDDDPDLRGILTDLLEDEGYAVTTAEAVLGAMALARRLRPDVILLDLGLPYRSGASLLPELKADPSTADIPVVVVSGMPEVLTAERRAMAAGVVAKPFDTEVLLAAVRAARRPARTRRRTTA
jgi:two-component system, NtrC family, nitrogen regulation response regulator NtrX